MSNRATNHYLWNAETLSLVAVYSEAIVAFPGLSRPISLMRREFSQGGHDFQGKLATNVVVIAMHLRMQRSGPQKKLLDTSLAGCGSPKDDFVAAQFIVEEAWDKGRRKSGIATHRQNEDAQRILLLFLWPRALDNCQERVGCPHNVVRADNPEPPNLGGCSIDILGIWCGCQEGGQPVDYSKVVFKALFAPVPRLLVKPAQASKRP
jgi:hypothetical protein